MPQLTELASRHCVPLRGAGHRLPHDEVQEFLNVLPGWVLGENDQAVQKSFKFDDYYRTMAFVNSLAFIAHREDHHPDLSVHYDRVEVCYSTHDVGGLSMNDFICAAKVEQLQL